MYPELARRVKRLNVSVRQFEIENHYRYSIIFRIDAIPLNLR